MHYRRGWFNEPDSSDLTLVLSARTRSVAGAENTIVSASSSQAAQVRAKLGQQFHLGGDASGYKI
jgi:hypothetical protein